MPTIAEQLKTKVKGKPDCEICKGTGMYEFHGSRIFCESCIGEEQVSMLWASIDNYIAKNAN